VRSAVLDVQQCDILKKKAFYTHHYTGNKKRFMLLSIYDELNDLLLKWFKQVRAKNIPLSDPILQETAMYFSKELELRTSRLLMDGFRVGKINFQ
jgi:hypothetical protein